jgi:hypothetical protein
MAWPLAGCADFGETAERAAGAGELASIRAALTVPVTSSEYQLPASVDPEIIGDRTTELWARVYRPATLLAGRRYPLLLFLHGNHHTCGRGSNPRIDDNSQYTTTGTCPAPDYVVVPSHEGYGYIAEELAAQEYIVVSVNANRGINVGAGVAGDSGLNLTRGRLVLKHLALLSHWDRTPSATPGSVGADLFEHIDFSHVGLMGHSRGGEGMRAAYAQYLDTDSPWPARIVTPVGFRGIFEIGPVDGQTSRVLNTQNVSWSVILPMCDGDVSSLAGIRPFDRSLAFLDETPPSSKASLTVWGANHNYYNSQWQEAEGLASCSDHEPIFTSGPGITGSALQRDTGRILMSAFFLGNVGQQQDPSRNVVFDPRSPLPNELTAITRVDRGYTPSPDADVTLRLEDFLNAAGTSSSGESNIHSNVTVTHGFLPEHDFGLRGGTLSWSNAGPSTFFQVNFTALAAGISLSAHATLDLRVERARDLQLNLTETTDFTLQLVDMNDGLSAPVRIADFLDLRGPVGWANGTHRMLQTARIPLANFAPIALESIRGVRLTFDQTPSGTIHVANIRATVGDAESVSAAPFPPNVGSTARSARPASRLATPSVSTGRIAALARVTRLDLGGAIDLAILGDTPFPGLEELPVLHSGDVQVTTLSRFPDAQDMRRLTFTLSAAQFAALKQGQGLSVSYGEREVWKLGPLDKQRLTP